MAGATELAVACALLSGVGLMKSASMCALCVALALPALGQTEPHLEPLLPRGTKSRPDSQPELPPLAPLAPPAGQPRGGASMGILVLGLPDAVAARVSDGLRAVLELAPSVKSTVTLQAPQPCANEACWVVAGAAGNVERVLVATHSGRTLRLKVLDVATRKQMAQGQREAVAPEAAEATAWAESVACKMLVPAGCFGEARVEAPAEVELELDGRRLQAGEKRILPVGVHALKVNEGGTSSTRSVPVLIEGTPPVSIAPALALAPLAPTPSPAAAPEAAPVAAVTSTAPPAPRRTWTRTAGYVTAGAAVAAAAVGLYFGAKSRSDLDQAESSYRANGAYQPSDLDALHSGNSSARTANALFIASGVLLAAGAALTFAF
jgi:hypothetical protein